MKLGVLRLALRKLANEYGDNAVVAFKEDEVFLVELPGLAAPPFHPDKPALRASGWEIDGGFWTLIDEERS